MKTDFDSVYMKGYVDGIRAFAWPNDDKQYVGSANLPMELNQAMLTLEKAWDQPAGTFSRVESAEVAK